MWHWWFCPRSPLLVIKTNFLVVGFPEKGAACLAQRLTPHCGRTCFVRHVVLCYYEAIRDPLPSAFTPISAVRLPPMSTNNNSRVPPCGSHAPVHLPTQQALLAAPAHWHAKCQLVSAACVMVSSSAAYTAGIGTRTWVRVGRHVSNVTAGMALGRECKNARARASVGLAIAHADMWSCACECRRACVHACARMRACAASLCTGQYHALTTTLWPPEGVEVPVDDRISWEVDLSVALRHSQSE